MTPAPVSSLCSPRGLAALLALGALGLVPRDGWGQAVEDGPYKSTPEYEALARDFKIVKVVEADLDGDILKETLVVFRDRQDDGNSGGGVVVLKPKGAVLRQAGCLYLDDNVPADLQVNGKDLVLGVSKADRAEEPARMTLTLGKDLVLRGDPVDPLAGMRITASSTTRSEPADVKFVFDQDLTTSWAEGASGTGIGETLTFEFKKPLALGLMLVFPGKGTGLKDFRDYNRVHRAVVELTTQSSTGDTSANLDFADLGIDLTGHKTEVTFANRPEMKVIKVAEPEVTKVVFRIDSVYLGDRKDDTHVAEAAFCPMLTDAEIQARVKKERKKGVP